MSKVSAPLFALAVLVGFLSPAFAGDTGVVCQWGIPGLNGSDPEMILGTNSIEVEFKPGTTELADTGKSTIAMEDFHVGEVAITSQAAGNDEQFRFSYPEANSSVLEVSVSKLPFKGRFAGLTAELAKQAVASTVTFKFPQGDSQVLPGLCFILK